MKNKKNLFLTFMLVFLSEYEDRKKLKKDIEIQKMSGILDNETAPYYKKLIEHIIPEKEKE